VLYVVAGGVAVVGAAIIVLSVWGLRSGFPFNTTRVIAPGSSELTLGQPGTYMIAYESRSTLDGRVFNTGALPPMRIAVLSAEGQEVPVNTRGIAFTYDSQSREGKAVARFTVKEPGQYTLTSEKTSQDGAAEVVLAIGRDTTGRFVLSILGIVAGVGAVILAGILAVITLILGTTAKRRAQPAYPPPSW
jgi:hypothetical protein